MYQSVSGLQPYASVGVYVMILGAAALTEWIGIHAIFGAFLLGVIIPSDSSIAKSFQSKLKEPVTVLLLPAFFGPSGITVGRDRVHRSRTGQLF